jgi:hypothetical protein
MKGSELRATIRGFDQGTAKRRGRQCAPRAMSQSDGAAPPDVRMGIAAALGTRVIVVVLGAPLSKDKWPISRSPVCR